MKVKQGELGTRIPQPPRLPVLGNLREIDRTAPLQSIIRLAREFGPIYRLDLPGRSVLILSSQELVNDVCDESRFDKLIGKPLQKVRTFSGDGLFTAWTFEPNWKKAHHILMPNFGPAAMQGYLPQMIDIADQLVGKWSRLNSDEVIHVADDMTRLTLDTIGLCGFDYRFNSFYRDDPHPFVGAMVRALGESLLQANRLALHEAILFRTHRRQAQDIEYMNSVVDRLVRERRADPEAMATKHDLLNYMLTGVDKQTGESLDDLNIRYQILTFLIAGHETTSGLLSFAFYFLLKHPDVLAKAYEEVDRVLNADVPTLDQVRRLTFIQQILKESLRLWPTAPAFSLYSLEATALAGRYQIKKNENLVALLPMLHRDRTVWGDDAEEFDPDRFSPERERQLPPNAYKPFGNGQRACIGQQFAMQEATLVLGMILRQFEPIDHANYQLHVKETLTLKPEGLTMKVRPRSRKSRPIGQSGPVTVSSAQAAVEAEVTPTGSGVPLLVLYGSNLGTAERVAQRIAADGRSHGFAASASALDEYTGLLPKEGVVVVVSASYNGLPPDNAVRFCEWIQKDDLGTDSFQGVRYAVFGCGDHNWTATFQAIPKLIDERLATHGATRICPRGEGDVADDFDGQFRSWYAEFWRAVAKTLGLAPVTMTKRPKPAVRIESVVADVDLPTPSAYDDVPLVVMVNQELQSRDPVNPSDRSTRHIELALPAGVTYQTGDHLGILPRNRPAIVERVLNRFQLDGNAHVILRRDESQSTHLPIDVPIRLRELLAAHVELQDAATRDQLATLADLTSCPPEKARLLAQAGKNGQADGVYKEEILAKRISLLDLLEQFPACELSFDEFLCMLPPLRPRYYSISSSPLISDRVASITVAVVRAAARSGHGVYEGVASNYLADLPLRETVQGFIRGPGTPFRPPADVRLPMIMVGAGTGLAPFRGFLQDRAAIKQRGIDVGSSLLVFGCRSAEHDFIYEQELHEFEQSGLVRVITAFSRQPGQPKCYVQNAITLNGDQVWDLVSRDAVIFVCGDAARMAPDVRKAFRELYQSRTNSNEAQSLQWLDDLRTQHRYIEDIWAS